MDFRQSEFKEYLLCRRKYLLKYVYELEHIPYSERPGSAAETGTIGHAGLAAYYRGEGLTGALDAAAREAASLGLTAHEADVAGQAAIRRYISWAERTHPDEGWSPLLIEERLRAKLGTFRGVDVYLTGQADIVAEDDFGGLHIVDHKFVANFGTQTGDLDMNVQGLTYAWLVSQHYDRPVDSFVLNMVLRKVLKKDPGLVVDRVTMYIDEHQLARHMEYMAVVADEMVRLHQEAAAGDEHRAVLNPGRHCSWCSFRNVCPMMDIDPDAAQEELNTRFRKRAPL